MTRRAPANAATADFRNNAVDAEGGWAFAAPPLPRFVYPVRSAPSQGVVVSTVIRSPVIWPIRRSTFMPGRNEVRHDALVAVSSMPDSRNIEGNLVSVGQLPHELLRYTLPSRYCDSDKLRSE